MENIKITPLNKIGQDERGRTFDFSIRKTSDFILCERKKGSKSGNTYHEGKNAATNPKTFILLNGTIEFSYRYIDSDIPEKIIISEPSIIEIQSLVTHAVKALTDIAMLECNSIKDIQDDRISLDVEI